MISRRCCDCINRYSLPKTLNVSVWGMSNEGVFQKTNASNYKDFRKMLRTNEWKKSLDPNMQSQIREHWLKARFRCEGRYDVNRHGDLLFNRLGRDARLTQEPSW